MSWRAGSGVSYTGRGLDRCAEGQGVGHMLGLFCHVTSPR